MKKVTALLMAVIMMMSAFSSYACIAASAASTDEVVSIADIFIAGKEKQTALKTETPDKETEEEPTDEIPDLDFKKDVKAFFHRIIERIKAIIALLRSIISTEPTPEPEPEFFPTISK